MPGKTFRALSLTSKAYIALVVWIGALVVTWAIYDLAQANVGYDWTVFALLTLLSGSATVTLPSLPATVSVSETFVFTSALLFGPSAGTVTVALDAAVISFWSYRKGQPAYKILFNVCALPLTIWLGSSLFFYLAGIQPLFRNPVDIRVRSLLLPLTAFTVVYFLLNSWIITIAICLERKLRPLKVWRQNFAKLALNYFGGASIAALFVSYTKELDYT
jgi:hypothetical protein